MSANNTCNFIGNLTRDPEAKKIKKDSQVVTFGVAINTRWDKDDDKKEVAFVEVEAWNGRGEFVANNFAKGDTIGMTCEYVLDRWVDKETEENRSRPKFRLVDCVPVKLAKWTDDPKPASKSKASAKPKPKPEPEPEDEEEEDEEDEEEVKPASKKGKTAAAPAKAAKATKTAKRRPEPDDDDDDDDDDESISF